MVKVILKGSKNTQWNIGGRFLDGGVPVDISVEEVQKHFDVIAEQLGEVKMVEQPKEDIKEVVKQENKLLTENEIFEMNATEQKELIKKFGEKPASTEVERVKQILKLQGGLE